MAKNSDKDDIGITRINHDVGNLTSIFQAHKVPRRTCIGGEIDATASDDIVAQVGFPGSHPNQIWIGRSQGNGADGGRCLLLKNRLPGEAAVLRDPNATSGSASIVDVGLIGNTGDGSDASAAHGRAEVAELDVFERIFRLVVFALLRI